MSDSDLEVAIGNMVMFHYPRRWERARRELRYWRTGRGGQMRCICGYVTEPGERFEYHQAREAVRALRKCGFRITRTYPWLDFDSGVPLRIT